MKRFSILLSLLLSISLIFALTSCGGTSSDTNTNKDTNSETDTGTGDTNTPTDTGDSNTNSPTDTENPENDNAGTQQPPVDTDEPVNPPSTDEPETPPTTDEPETPPTTDNPGTDNPGQTPDTPDVPPVEEKMTLQEFLAHNDGETAKDFALDVIDDMSNYDAMKGIYYSLVGDEGKITKVNVAFIVDGEGTQRKLMQAEINIVGGVEMEDVVDGEVGEFTTTAETTGTLLTFDAKEEANKGINSTIQATIRNAVSSEFGVQAQTIKTYQPEEFSATVADWAEANKQQINEFMNSNYLTTFGKKAMSLAFKPSAIAEGQWVFEGEDKIEAIKFLFNYKQSSGSEYIYAVVYNLDEPVEMGTFLNAPISINSSKMQSYVFNYNPTIQGTRDDLINALFKAVGVDGINGTRYLKDNGQGAGIDGLGMAHGFTVVEVGEKEIKEYVINVNVANDDAGYINKLKNPSEYKIFSSKIIDITGASVEYVAQAEN